MANTIISPNISMIIEPKCPTCKYNYYLDPKCKGCRIYSNYEEKSG